MDYQIVNDWGTESENGDMGDTNTVTSMWDLIHEMRQRHHDNIHQNYLKYIKKYLDEVYDEEIKNDILDYIDQIKVANGKNEKLKRIVKKLHALNYDGDSIHRFRKINNLIIMLLILQIQHLGWDIDDIEEFIISFPEVICITPAYDNQATDSEENTLDMFELQASMQQYMHQFYIQAQTRQSVQEIKSVAVKKSIKMALMNPEYPHAFLVPHRYKYPEVEEAEEWEVFDEEHPTIFIGHLSEDQLSIAREVDKIGGVNIVFPLAYRAGERAGLWEIAKSLVYKKGGIYFVEFKKQISPDFVVDNDLLSWSHSGRTIKNIGNAAVEATLQNKLSTAMALLKMGIETSIQEKGKISSENYLIFSDEDDDEAIQAQIVTMTEKSPNGKCVIKPLECSGGLGVMIVKYDDIVKNNTACKKILRHIRAYTKAGHTMSCERFIQPYGIKIDEKDVDWNLRVFVTRDDLNELVIEKGIIVRYGERDTPINISRTAKVTGIKNIQNQIPNYEEVCAEIEKLAIRATQAIEAEAKDSVDPDNTREGVTNDFYGWDIILEEASGGKVKPVIIEGNGSFSGGMWDLDNVQPPEQHGEACGKLAKLIVRRAKEEKSRKFIK